MPALLTRLKINRVAAVDRGAGEGVKVLLWKRDGGRHDMPDVKHATITETDAKKMLLPHLGSLGPALVAKGNSTVGGLRDAVAKINDAMAGLDRSICSIANDNAVTAKGAEIKKSVDQFTAHLSELGFGEVGKLLAADIVSAHPLIAKGDRDMALPQNEADLKKMVDEMLTKATGPLTDTIAVLKYDNAVLKMTPTQKAHHDGLGTDALKKEFAAKPDAEKDKEAEEAKAKKGLPADVAKALEPVIRSNEDLTKRNVELEKTVGAMTERDAVTEFTKRATDLGLPAAHGEVMRKAYKGDPEAIKAHEQALKGMVEQARTGKLFSEFGKQGGGAATAYDELVAKAKVLLDRVEKGDNGKALTPEQAFTKVYTDPSNREIADRYRTEQSNKISGRAA